MQNQSLNLPLPGYGNPPVVETILGVQFEPLPGFSNGHLGAFWKTLPQIEWPQINDAPPLEPVFERFSETGRWVIPALQLKFSQDFAGRLQARNPDGDRMMQVQNGRLLFNWLKRQATPYPRYSKVREGFENLFDSFRSFCEVENLGKVQPNQWEVTYLNHIPKGTVWNEPEDWTFFRGLSDLPDLKGTATPEGFSGEWHFAIPEEKGRLHIRWQHTLKKEPEATEVLVLTLTARGPIPKGKAVPSAVFDGLDLGRETIVRSFETLMSDSANQYWELKK